MKKPKYCTQPEVDSCSDCSLTNYSRDCHNNPMWGGKREGAGRPATGRKKRGYYVTDEEHEAIKKFIEEMRSMKNWKSYTLVDSDGGEFTYDSEHEMYVEAMREFKNYDTMTDIFFAEPEPGQEELGTEDWGPDRDKIDWAGIDVKIFTSSCDCDAESVDWTCVDCGKVRYIGHNCGNVVQPTPVSPSKHGGDPVCDECEEKRDIADGESK